MRCPRKPLVVVIAASCGMGGGCTSSPYGLNKELALGPGGPRPYLQSTLSSEYSAAGREAAAAPIPTAAPAPARRSLVLATTEESQETAGGTAMAPAPTHTRIDRANWEPMRVDVPNDLSAHQPRYTRSVFEDTHLGRNRGDYPTAETANQITHRKSLDSQMLEAVGAPVAAAVDLVLFLPRAVVNQPWDPTRTGLEPYRRVPNPSASLSTVATTPRVRTKPGLDDPAGPPVQVPVGEYFPVAPPQNAK